MSLTQTPEAATRAAPAHAAKRATPVYPLPRRLLSPQFFDFWARHFSPTLSWSRPLARVVERRAASASAVTLVLKPNSHWRGAAPGQHINLSVEIDGARHTRSYSLSAPVRADGCIEITVAEHAGGRVSPHLNHALQVGDVVELGQAFGELTLPAKVQGEWLLLSAGSGITPLMALIRQLAVQQMPVPLTLLYWEKQAQDLCFADELRALAARWPNFRVEFQLTRAPGDPSDRINAESLAALVPDLATKQVYACGSGGFVEAARALCVSAKSFTAEGFTPAPSVHAETGTAQVTLARSGRVLELPRDRPLLLALEEQGIRPAFGCRMGICNTCSCEKLAGSSRDLRSGALDDEARSPVRLCIHSAASDLTLDL
jgi:ferredoxin-NADP reductase